MEPLRSLFRRAWRVSSPVPEPPTLPEPEAPPLSPAPPQTTAPEPPEAAPAPASVAEAGPVPRSHHGSQTRQRTKGIYVACTPDEYAALTAKAASAGLSAGGYLRACGFGAPTPRTKRQAPPDRALFAEAISALNRTGSNINQIARALNRDGLAPPADLTEALRGYASALNLLMRAAGGANDY